MEKKELVIGKQGDYTVVDSYVGRRHARLIREDNGLYIEDLESKNGTYVNGKSVKRKKITASDVIKLGPSFTLNLADVLASLPMSDAEFTQAFIRLKEVYDSYSNAQLDVSTQVQSPMISRMLGSIPGLLIAGTTMIPSMQNMGGLRVVIILIGVGVSVAGGVLSDNIMTKRNRAKQKKLRELSEQFSIDYSCPSCQNGFGNRSWEALKKQGQCPACKRKFNVK
jgi:hypothetical protein